MKSPHVWVTSTYFAEGFPYSVVNQMAELVFKSFGATMQEIGLTALFHLPWNLKFLWGPFLDQFATKRAWILGCEVACSVLILVLAIFSTLPSVLITTSFAFLLLAFVSATHDIAIDGYYLEGLDKKGQAKYVGYRATAYRIAMFVVSGPLVIVVGKLGWFVALSITAVLMGVILLQHASFLPRVETPQRPFRELLAAILRLRFLLIAAAAAAAIVLVRTAWRSTLVKGWITAVLEAAPALGTVSVAGWIAFALLGVLLVVLALLVPIKRSIEKRDSFYARAFVTFLDQPKVGRILAFVLLFRVGESFVLKMRVPFLMDAGLSVAEYGFYTGSVGLVASFSATFLGGWLISRDGLRRWIWVFIVAQNFLNLLYAFAATYGPEAPTSILATVITVESFGAGLGTAVFMVYLMRTCRPGFKAAHMAIVTALMSVGFTVAGVVSGFLANALGYTVYFVFTFFASVPAMVLVPFLPHLDEPEGEG